MEEAEKIVSLKIDKNKRENGTVAQLVTIPDLMRPYEFDY